MESDDNEDWFRRWRRGWPFGAWPFGDMEQMMREMERAFAEQFKELEKEIPRALVRERKLPDGSTTKEIGPIVYGYSMTIGPDGKPVIREFGNVKRGEGSPWKEIQDAREPLVDVVQSDKDIRVIVELPGVNKEDINLIVDEGHLTIDVNTVSRKYHKKLELPAEVEPDRARSTFKNGILEVTLPLKSQGGKGVRLKVE